MKTTNSSLLIVLIFTGAILAQQPPPTLWERTYGGNHLDFGYNVEQTQDGGFIVVGSTRSFGGGNKDVYLIKTDANGDTIWTRTYGNMDQEIGFDVEVLNDGNYAVVGRKSGLLYLLKIDNVGDTIWTKRIRCPYETCGYSIQQTNDGGFIITGYAVETSTLSKDFLLVKTNVLGDTLWTKSIGRRYYHESGICVQQTSDNGFIIAGITTTLSSYQIWLLKTSVNGGILWTKTYGPRVGYGVQQTTDGGFIIVGINSQHGYGDVYLIKTDMNGDTVWTQTFGCFTYDAGFSVQQTTDGGFIIGAQSVNDGYLIKTDAEGNGIWYGTYGYTTRYLPWCARQTDNGGYIFVGNTNDDVYLVRLGPDSPAYLSFTPRSYPVIVPPGGLFRWDYRLINHSGINATFDAWTEVLLPNGNYYGPVIRYDNLNIRGHATMTGIAAQTVPNTAPAGVYHYIGKVGIYPDSVLAQSWFPFEVSSAGDNKLIGEGEGWGDGNWLGGETLRAADSPQSAAFPDKTADCRRVRGLCDTFSATPNPFNQRTDVSFHLRDAGQVKLAVYDISGREVASLVNGHLSSGPHEIAFDGTELASGVYFAMLEAGGVKLVRKLLLVK